MFFVIFEDALCRYFRPKVLYNQNFNTSRYNENRKKINNIREVKIVYYATREEIKRFSLRVIFAARAKRGKYFGKNVLKKEIWKKCWKINFVRKECGNLNKVVRKHILHNNNVEKFVRNSKKKNPCEVSIFF